MVVKNGHKWNTLDDNIYVCENNRPKKVIAIYAGRKLVYPKESIDISDLRKWTQYDMSPSIDYTNKINTFSWTMTVEGYERLYIPVDLKTNCNYIFSATIQASNYTERNSRQPSHTYIAVTDYEPTFDAYLEDRTVTVKTQYYPGVTNTYTAEFNTGNTTRYYLIIDFVACTNNQTASFVIWDLSIKEKRN